jgi:co-chaperonin GroES (HSP10)
VKIQPLFDKIIVKQTSSESKTPSGLVLVDNKNKPCVGKVIAAGVEMFYDGRTFPMPVSEGDSVAYMRDAGIELLIDGEAHRMLRATELVGKIHS